MSIITPPPAPSSSTRSTAGEKASPAHTLIESRIAEAASALWWAELIRRMLVLVIGSVAVLLTWLVLDHWITTPGTVFRWIVFVSGLIAVATYVNKRILPLLGNEILPDYAARSLERDLPELRQALTSYVTLSKDPSTADLHSRVVRSIGASTANRLKSHNSLPVEATGTMGWWLATAAAFSVLIAYALFSPKNSLESAARLIAPMANIDAPRRVSITDVLPGNVDAIAGRQISVSATVAGMRPEEEVVCEWDSSAGPRRFTMSNKPDGGPRRFSGPLQLPHSASGQVSYRVLAGDSQAGPFMLNVRDIPVVALQSILHRPPAYVGRPEYSTSSGEITAIDGTEIVIRAGTNRAVNRAVIEFNPKPLGDVVRATAGATEMKIDEAGTSLTTEFMLKGSRGRSSAVEIESYRIVVWDKSDQSNFDPIVYPIRIIADLPPEVSIVMPTQSPKNVPVNAQQIIEVHASDPDFGLQEIRLELRSGIDLIDEPVLWRSTDQSNAGGNRVAEFRFRPAEIIHRGSRLQIGDRVQVVAVAVDNRIIQGDPTIEPNVTRTDPIELKLVAADTLPPAGEPESEGMSAPDDRPSADPEQGEESGQKSSEDGAPQSGGGGSGGEGAAKQQKGDGNSGTGQSGESDQTGEPSSDDPSGSNASSSDGGDGAENGKAAGNGSESGSNSQPSPNNDRQDPSDSQSEGGSPSNPSQSGNQDSGANGGDPSMSGQDAGTDPGTQQAGNQASGGQSAGDQNSTGQNSANQQSTDQQSENGDEPSGDAGSESGEGGQSETESPQHDGEAFERIKDYLDKKAQGEQSQGEQSGGEKASGDKGQQDTGQPQPNQSSGEKSNSQNGQPSGSEKGGQKSAPESSGQGQGDSKSGQQASGEQTSGDQSSSEQTSAPESGDPGSTGQPGQPNQGSSNESQGDGNSTDSGEPAGNTPPADSKSDGTKGADSKAGDSNSAEPKTNESGSETPQPSGSDQPKPGESERPGDGDSSQTDSPKSESNQSDSSKGKSADSKVSGDAVPGIGNGSDGNGKGGDAVLPPDPVNAEYAKKATDMVLDYLEQTRDQPDEQLLEKLNWTDEDLQQFRDRWKDVRDIDPSAPAGDGSSRNIEEALRSLGMRGPGIETGDTQTDSADSLRGIRDSGNRKPPPAAYRDAFDAFRRAMGNRK